MGTVGGGVLLFVIELCDSFKGDDAVEVFI